MRDRVVFLAACLLFGGCAQADTPCEKAAEKAREILEDCGLTFTNYHDNLNSECTPRVQALVECYLACYEQASCAVYLAEDLPGLHDFDLCRNQCLHANP